MKDGYYVRVDSRFSRLSGNLQKCGIQLGFAPLVRHVLYVQLEKVIKEKKEWLLHRYLMSSIHSLQGRSNVMGQKIDFFVACKMLKEEAGIISQDISEEYGIKISSNELKQKLDFLEKRMKEETPSQKEPIVEFEDFEDEDDPNLLSALGLDQKKEQKSDVLGVSI